MHRIATLVVTAAVTIGAAACGEGGPRPKPKAAAESESCPPAAVARRARGRAHRDVASMWHIARSAHPGLGAMRRLTDRFLRDAADVPPLRRNRLIDLAAGASTAASCTDCFQALEASRPIPQLAYSGSRCR